MSDIDFYFDFSSPYGYLAAVNIDEVAARHGRAVRWRPIMLGVIFKTTGNSPLLHQPLKGDYARRDLARSARRLGVPFVLPEPFPFPSIAACRAFYALTDDEPDEARKLAGALYHAAFAVSQDISGAEGVLAVAAECGLDQDWLTGALRDPAVKGRLRAEMDQAIARGVFGSPYFVVDGEPFWGHDRLGDVEDWLKTGGW